MMENRCNEKEWADGRQSGRDGRGDGAGLAHYNTRTHFMVILRTLLQRKNEFTIEGSRQNT